MSPNAGGGEGRVAGYSQWVQLYTGAQINFGDLTPYLTYALGEPDSFWAILNVVGFKKVEKRLIRSQNCLANNSLGYPKNCGIPEQLKIPVEILLGDFLHLFQSYEINVKFGFFW
jgi:hypothetical protein